MKKIKLPLLAGRWLDLPPRITRTVLTSAGLGIIMVTAGSLVGKQTGTIGVDKVIHCSAYALLAALKCRICKNSTTSFKTVP